MEKVEKKTKQQFVVASVLFYTKIHQNPTPMEFLRSKLVGWLFWV